MIAVLINAEKKYGQDFWHCKRRIQASVCHFFAIFVYFIFSFFPKQDTRETLESLKSTNRLCTSLKALEVHQKFNIGAGKLNIVGNPSNNSIFISTNFCRIKKIDDKDVPIDSVNSSGFTDAKQKEV